MRIDQDVGQERVLQGLGVSPGVAIGPLHLRESGEIQVIEYQIAAEEVPAEIARFDSAIEKAAKQLESLKSKSESLHGASAEELGYLLDAHSQMLNSSQLKVGVAQHIGTRLLNAEAAVFQQVSSITQAFNEMDDPYLRSRGEEVRQVGYRILRNLTNSGAYSGFGHLPISSIVAAEEITPADTALMDPKIVAGFASVMGGAEGHTAIMARSLGIPAVLGLGDLMRMAEPGAMTIIDGSAGLVILNPSAARLAYYEQRRSEIAAAFRALEALKDLPAETRDGLRISLQANVELPADSEEALKAGAEGVGLFRTEFLFMNREDLPSRKEQGEALRSLVEAMEGRPVTIRTLDVGGEKLASTLSRDLGESPNPAMGLRAIRLSLKVPELLDTQLQAMLDAALEGPLRILIPMVVSLDEIRAVKAALLRLVEARKASGEPLPERLPEVGVMIEIPGAALSADSLAQEADFFAIGTNDLIMYALAIDRGEERVAHLYNPVHPAVLRLIHFTVEAAQRHSKPVSVCGEMAGDPRYAALFVGLGVTDLSMRAKALPTIKDRIRRLDANKARSFVARLMRQSDPEAISAALSAFNRDLDAAD